MKQKRFFAALTLGAVLATSGASAVWADSPSPFDPQNSAFENWRPVLVDDAVQPRRAEIAAVDAWTRSAFGGAPDSTVDAILNSGAVAVVVERQDYSRLRFDETCVGRKFEFPNGDVFATGLGTHSHSRLRFVFPKPIASFSARLGIARDAAVGSVRGAVEASGQTVFQSEIVRGTDDAPIPVELKFAPPVSEFALLIDDADDGPAFDQANWLNPVATTADGETFDLVADSVVSRLRSDVPFSFEYDGVSSREFLADWPLTVEKIDACNDVYVWRDPKTKLAVSATVRRFERFAAADWVLRFKNEGGENSGTISNVQVVDAAFEYGFERTDLAIHTLRGDTCDENAWLPIVETVAPGKTKTFAPVGGRSSNGAFPFWNVTSRRYGDLEPSEGLFVALGWSGQWNASFENVDSTLSQTNVRAGMERISTILYPGEEIRSPRALIMPWRADRSTAQARFRRLLTFEYAPKIDGAPVKMEFVAQCFDRYYRKRAGWEKAESQIESAKRLKAIDGTAYWFDAAWFPVGFPNGVGNWFSDKTNFPNGVEELGVALEKLGLDFILWFEPERVAPETEIATKYPQYVFGGEKGGLFKLNNPEARRFLTELLLKRIKEFRVDVYRNDFNIDPLSFWRANDEPNRQGMTEIRYVEGHYEMWNRFRAENPGLWIDNCASGGRRIDLETTSISVPLWRSDTCCWPGHPEWDQTQTLGLAQYLPLFSCSSWDSSPYTFRSAANPGAIMQYDFLGANFDAAEAKASLDEAKTYQKFWYGDFYALTDAFVGKRDIVAWQLHRADLNAGVVYVFRQTESPYPGLELELRALDKAAKYRVAVKTGYAVDRTFEATGAELSRYLLMLEKRGTACVLEYEALK